MPIIADIMTTEVSSICETDNLHTARKLMKDQHIRHMPVVNNQGALVGVLTQRAVLAAVIKLVDKVGVEKMERREKQIEVSSIMEANFQTAAPDLELKQAAQHFLVHKHSCLPIIENDRLVGILTSQDFVKLCETLL